MNVRETDRTAIAPECGPTLERVQAVMDRIHPATIQANDPHSLVCPACRERVRAAQLILSAFPEPREVARTGRGATPAASCATYVPAGGLA